MRLGQTDREGREGIKRGKEREERERGKEREEKLLRKRLRQRERERERALPLKPFYLCRKRLIPYARKRLAMGA